MRGLISCLHFGNAGFQAKTLPKVHHPSSRLQQPGGQGRAGERRSIPPFREAVTWDQRGYPVLPILQSSQAGSASLILFLDFWSFLLTILKGR